MLKRLRRWKGRIADKIYRPLGEQRTVSVTNDDLANGKHNSAGDCPVARAVKRMFPGVWSVLAGYDFITVGFPDRIETWRNRTRTETGERELGEFMRKIDHLEYVEPRDFIIERTYLQRYQ